MNIYMIAVLYFIFLTVAFYAFLALFEMNHMHETIIHKVCQENQPENIRLYMAAKPLSNLYR